MGIKFAYICIVVYYFLEADLLLLRIKTFNKLDSFKILSLIKLFWKVVLNKLIFLQR